MVRIHTGSALAYPRQARYPSRARPHTYPPGRAVQAGGSDITVKLDGVEKPRTVNRVTFYRHLRDIQAVRQP